MARTAFTGNTLDHLTAMIAGRDHAMAGPVTAVSAALACSLGEGCVRINASCVDDEVGVARSTVANHLLAIRDQLLSLADEDSLATAAHSAAENAGQRPQGQDRLCEMQILAGNLAVEAGVALQAVRPLMCEYPADLEVALALLVAAGRAASMVLDANLSTWREAELAFRYRPALADLRRKLAQLRPADRFC